MAGQAHIVANNLYQPLTDPVEPSNNKTPHGRGSLWAARFVSLLPGRFNDPIQCQLVHSTIGEMESQYEALSYTWGDHSDKYQACVNTTPFLITRNLENALRNLRLQHANRILWVDSLCINQGDIAEVHIQVQRMWAIYQNAHRVVVFLGPRDEGSDAAFRLLSELAVASIPLGRGHLRVTALLENPDEADSWQSLLRLLQRPWWRRAWIVQEYAVAQVAVFMCGTVELPDECFGQALTLLVDFRFNGNVPPGHQRLLRHVASTPIHHLWTTRRNYQTLGLDARLEAASVLYRFRGSKSSDPRDKVYSLYRLIAENERLKPDYGKSTVDLFQDVVQVMMETSGTLEVLSHHNRQAQEDGCGILGLPSWCPDWTVMRGKRMLLWPNGYQAAGTHGELPFFKIDKGVLTLRGKILETIRWLDVFESDDFDNTADIHRRILNIKAKARQMAVQGTSLDTLEDAINRTLVAERIHKKGPNQEATRLGRGEADPLWCSWSREVQGGSHHLREEEARWFNDALYSAMSGRAFVITEKGTLGLADGTVRAGDVAGLFLGGQVPLTLRLQKSCRDTCQENITNRYQLVGECFLHGHMSGSEFPSKLEELVDVALV